MPPTLIPGKAEYVTLISRSRETGSFAGGLYGLALFGLISAFVCAFFLHIPNRTLSAVMPTVGARAG
jgi:hypothetical protein